MFPAHDQITTFRIVAVLQKVAALVFKLDGHALPALGNLFAGNAVGVGRADFFNDKADVLADLGEDGHNSHFIYWTVNESPVIDDIANDALGHWLAPQRGNALAFLLRFLEFITLL